MAQATPAVSEDILTPGEMKALESGRKQLTQYLNSIMGTTGVPVTEINRLQKRRSHIERQLVHRSRN